MNKYTVKFPSYTIGVGAFEEIEKICSPYGTKLAIIGGKCGLESIRTKLYDALESSGLEPVIEIFYGGECSSKRIEELTTQLGTQAIDMIFAVGGGRALDTAKAVANNLQKPVFTIPTIAATCAASTKLSVVYNEAGVFETFYFYEVPPVHVFIDTDVIANAPLKYLRAGIGDTLAKHYECTFASRGEALDHNSGLAVAMSKMCVDPLLAYGEKALVSVEEKQTSFELEQVVLANIMTTGFVSMLIEEDYNGAVAHSLFYGLTTLPHIEANYLHGDVVGYGVLVQLMLDGKQEEVKKLRHFYQKIGIPVTLENIEVEANKETLKPVIENVLAQPDMKVIPYAVTVDSLLDAVLSLETVK